MNKAYVTTLLKGWLVPVCLAPVSMVVEAVMKGQFIVLVICSYPKCIFSLSNLGEIARG